MTDDRIISNHPAHVAYYHRGRLEERAKIAAFFRKHGREQYAQAIENGEHDQ